MTQWISLSNQRSGHRPVCVWTSERDRGALPYFDVKNGRRTGRNYYNVPTPTEEIYPSS